MSASAGVATTNGAVSFWWAQIGQPMRRAPLDGSRRADVCIVGGGYTGLWTAYALKRADPALDVVVLEAEFCGFGASGRNGGWLTHDITGRDRFLASAGRDAVVRFQRAMDDAVDEVVATARTEGIDADIHRGGELDVAVTPSQLRRLQAHVEHERSVGNTDLRLLPADEARSRVAVSGALGASWHEHCARIQPAKLVRGLAEAVERLGVRVFESTRAREITPRLVRTARGDVTAPVVIRATEGFTAGLAGERRRWLPMNSSLIVTEPLPAAFWREVGWEHRDTLGDGAHVYVYAQRTADDRIAIGGRGVPYRYGSRFDADGRTPARTIAQLREMLVRLFPAARDAAIDHAWSGVLGVPRDWAATVSFERRTGLGHAGGYVGTGVTTTNLAGRTLADLVLERDTELVHLPWVNHGAKRWEPEPLRFLAVQAVYGAYRAADRHERRGRASTSPLARAADLLAGRS
ncbi:FAD-dependent oxidoreductase [Amnibacterium sp. CER49]|uniref:NAD(P)/FAD-dependent oxidoreductase n=1 Tax=Amnibacterium sp. CER49 TaxID=3039161 RepID=UPI002448B494|nr:FAD-dependent oxidoreductase [Amnibacterium sp. CER49]MDH2443363.1 FAD-dependent oxidoreductase [Amnibacterium sp. CER49]